MLHWKQYWLESSKVISLRLYLEILFVYIELNPDYINGLISFDCDINSIVPYKHKLSLQRSFFAILFNFIFFTLMLDEIFDFFNVHSWNGVYIGCAFQLDCDYILQFYSDFLAEIADAWMIRNTIKAILWASKTQI